MITWWRGPFYIELVEELIYQYKLTVVQFTFDINNHTHINLERPWAESLEKVELKRIKLCESQLSQEILRELLGNEIRIIKNANESPIPWDVLVEQEHKLLQIYITNKHAIERDHLLKGPVIVQVFPKLLRYLNDIRELDLFKEAFVQIKKEGQPQTLSQIEGIELIVYIYIYI